MAHPSEEDESLKNLILFAGTASLGLTFVIAVAVSMLGTDLIAKDIGVALLCTFLPGIYLSVLSMFLGGARRLVLYAMGVPCFALSILLGALMIGGLPGHWLLYLPSLVFLTMVCWVAIRQASLDR